MKHRNETQEGYSDGNRSRQPLSFALGLAAGIIALAPANAPAQGIPPTVWKPTSFQYDTGLAPSVAVSGVVVVEVHQAGTGLGPLWYHTGKIQENGTVAWAAAGFQYDNGINPSVAISGDTVIEVHQAGTGVGPLFYHTGKINASGTVTWASNSFQYDTGAVPSVAVVRANHCRGASSRHGRRTSVVSRRGDPDQRHGKMGRSPIQLRHRDSTVGGRGRFDSPRGTSGGSRSRFDVVSRWRNSS